MFDAPSLSGKLAAYQGNPEGYFVRKKAPWEGEVDEFGLPIPRKSFGRVLSRVSIDTCRVAGSEFWLTGVLRSFLARLPLKLDETSIFSIDRSSLEAQVFYNIDCLCEQWSRFLTVISVAQRAYGYQTAILFEKP